MLNSIKYITLIALIIVHTARTSDYIEISNSKKFNITIRDIPQYDNFSTKDTSIVFENLNPYSDYFYYTIYYAKEYPIYLQSSLTKNSSIPTCAYHVWLHDIRRVYIYLYNETLTQNCTESGWYDD